MYGSMDRELDEEIPLRRSPNIGGISYFGCKWRVATDDLVFPSFLETLSRIIGLIAIVTLYFSEYTDAYIQHYGLNDYLIGYGAICFLICLNLIFLGLNSMQGNIWDERLHIRVFVVPLMYVNALFVVGEVLWLSYGSYNMHRAWTNADNIQGAETVNALLSATLAVIVLSWIGFLLKLFLSVLFFKKVKHGQSFAKHLQNQFNPAHTFRIIGDSISFFFHDPDFVPTDTAAALFLLDLYRKKSPHHSEATTTAIPQDFNYSDMERYMKFSSAIYGFFHLPLLKHMGGFMRILGKGTCFCCFKERHAVESEGPLGSNFNTFAVFYALPFLTLDSFLFLNFNNDISVTPYMVVLDKERKKIVITIRGSMSFKDFFTDLLMASTPIDGYENYYTHKGFMDAARNIHTELREREILDKALGMNPGYDIVVTGHSLGGAVAVVLAFLLRILYKSTLCYAYAAPLCLNESARVESEEFVVHVTHGDDLITRLTPTNFALLVNQMRHVLRYSKVPKYKILGLKIFSCLFPRIISLDDTLLLRSEADDMLPRKMLINKYNRKHSTVLDLSLSLPGRILYIRKHKDDYSVRELPHTFFSEVIISTQMSFDHLPINFLAAIGAVRQRNDAQNDPQSTIRCTSKVFC